MTAARKQLLLDLDAIYSVARVTGRLEEAKDLGKPGQVGTSAPSVTKAYQTYLSKAEASAALLGDAGIKAKKLAAREATLTQLSTIGTAKAQTKTTKNAVSASIKDLGLALECGFGFYRGQAISALEEDPDSIPAAVSYCPRAPDRRNAPAKPPTDETDDDETEETDEEEEQGEGTGGDGEGAAKDETSDAKGDATADGKTEDAKPAKESDKPASDAAKPDKSDKPGKSGKSK